MSESSTIDPETGDWLTLDEDEEIVWSGKPHESSLIPALVVGLPLSLVLIGLFIIAGAYLQRENMQYVVTTGDILPVVNDRASHTVGMPVSRRPQNGFAVLMGCTRRPTSRERWQWVSTLETV
jgi:hypothetical protein